jgi:hypothetical protein
MMIASRPPRPGATTSGVRGPLIGHGGGRAWLALAYALATVLVQGAHRHDEGDEGADHAMVGCDDPRAGMAGHDAPDHGRPSAECQACQLRVQPPFWQMPATAVLRPDVADRPPCPEPVATPRTPFRLLPSRAPPLA